SLGSKMLPNSCQYTLLNVFEPFEDWRSFVSQYRKLAMAYHPDKARGDPELFKDISDLKTQLEKEQDPVMVAKMVFDGTYGKSNTSTLVRYQLQPHASSAGASFQTQYRTKLSCHNCKKQHLIEECPWLFCMFCWSQLRGQHHRCVRVWVQERWVTVGNYRREMLRRWDMNHSYEQLKEFWSSEYSRFHNSKRNVCVYCRREPNDDDTYVCVKCRIKVGCRGCCNMKWQCGEACPLCDSPNW
uniref:J domain-containing protein n=1 Tax=Panagrolaimus sp. ES5 TaxID=591445 RepID=A0AC34G8K6_9BILA